MTIEEFQNEDFIVEAMHRGDQTKAEGATVGQIRLNITSTEAHSGSDVLFDDSFAITIRLQ